MSNYTNKNNVEKYLGEDLPASLDTYISAWLNAVDNWIENYIGRKFKDIAVATKYYDTYGSDEIYIDDFEGNPTSVQILDADGDVEETLTIDEDYRIYPWNETGKNKLILMQNGRIGSWPNREKALKVTASFGKTTAPADIVLVATMLMANVLRKYLKGGETTHEQVGDVSFTYKAIDEAAEPIGIYNILNQYRVPIL
ncbi:MAG: hypothetical protein UV20_C0009G0022 [Candidatus Magasanikbacteria bacterium GW2011_GWA2_42_32]|uniref:Phage gp6-like head-tail connector protein n=1 Tax=Candidatus Magasanikbacteria bacterium GW2011_GWA2_42_32 TaxID=1619039 RepID=A0A0G1D3G6_9BACT|nr:MAG: hypothetical protein UV20_C0009G0022 [Candidatus Magasanikbacteria bacterium GW2011_GWA2_42_32]HBX15903.1 hypothetical protein [Candidatus Magasanikbacteria bacterium]